MKYKYLEDLTSDVMFKAYGNDLKELFENSAEALLKVICQLNKIKPVEVIEVEVEGEDVQELMFNWLQELIVLVDTEEMFFSKFEIIKISENKLKAKIYGEPITPEKGETVVKSITNYGFKVEKKGNQWTAKISMDT